MTSEAGPQTSDMRLASRPYYVCPASPVGRLDRSWTMTHSQQVGPVKSPRSSSQSGFKRRAMFALLVLLVSTAAFAESVKVTVDRASVWGNTTGTAGVIGVVRRGDVLEVLNHEGRWLFVVLPSDPRQRGYILQQQTEPTSGTPPTAPGTAAQRPPRTTSANRRLPKPPPFLYFGIVGRAASLDFSNDDSITTLLETETRSIGYKLSRRPGFEFAIGQEVGRNLIVTGTLVQVVGRGTASISAKLPHPIFYATPRSLTGDAEARRVETAIHLEFAKALHRSASYQLTAGAGPSVFFVNQELIDKLQYGEVYPFDSVTFTGATFARHSKAAFGAHVQVDFAKPITRKVSLQVLGRYSYGLAKIPVNGVTAKTKAGGAQVGGGLRVNF